MNSPRGKRAKFALFEAKKAPMGYGALRHRGRSQSPEVAHTRGKISSNRAK